MNAAGKKELAELIEQVKKIPDDGEDGEGFWKSAAEETFVDWASLLYHKGNSPHFIMDMLEDLYSATADCYGD